VTIVRPTFRGGTTPGRGATEQESTRARADLFADLEQPMRELAIMVLIVTTLSQEPPRTPPGITQNDVVQVAINHLDRMMQDVFGNYRDRLEETAVQP
jgi:hypothetical protein